MDSIQTLTTKAAIEDYPHWDKVSSVCDVGGSLGRLTSSLLKKFPNIKQGVILDLPDVIEQAKKRFTEEESEEINYKISFVGGSFFEVTIPKCEIYILRQILHDWSDVDSTKILNNVRNSMSNESKLLIFDNVLPSVQDYLPLGRHAIDIMMMSMLNGKERTEKEFVQLFKQSGLKLQNIYETRALASFLEVVKELLKDSRVDPSAKDNYAVSLAAEKGFVEVVRELLKDSRVDPSADDNYAIYWASRNGHLECVKELLKDSRVNPADSTNRSIRAACEGGFTEIVLELLKHERVNPADDENSCLCTASKNGHLEIVKALLKDPRVDPSARSNTPIKWGSHKGHCEIVTLLLKHPKTNHEGSPDCDPF